MGLNVRYVAPSGLPDASDVSLTQGDTLGYDIQPLQGRLPRKGNGNRG
jgi:hypothetical protein